MKFINLHQIALINLAKAYTEGIYADTPNNRKLGRVGMTYAAYAAKMKGEGDKKEEKTSQQQNKPNKSPEQLELEKTHASAMHKDEHGNMIATFETSFAKAEIVKVPASMSSKGYNTFSPTITSIDGDDKWRSTDEEFSTKGEAEKWIKEQLSKHLEEKKNNKEEKSSLSHLEARTILDHSDTLKNASTRQLDNVIKYSGFDIDKKLSDDEKKLELTKKYYKSAELYEMDNPKDVANALDGIIEDALEDYVQEEEETETFIDEDTGETVTVAKKKNKEKPKFDYKFSYETHGQDVLANTPSLRDASEEQINRIIDYTNSDGANGIKINKKDNGPYTKRHAIVQFYWDAADGDTVKEKAENLDSIIEDALEDSISYKK